MGKAGGKKKKSGSGQNQSSGANGNLPPVVVNGGVNMDPSVLLKRAHEIREEGNKRFQTKDYAGAFQQYENAIKLIPKTHPDRAVFHSNRAACLMLMKPIDYETVVSECDLALQVQPHFVRALLRRARAYEGMGKHEMAMKDVQSLLILDPNHGDALEIAARLRMTLEPQHDLQSRPSPAALGASAVRGAPIAGLGPCLPARPVPKKQQIIPPNKPEKLYPIPPVENGPADNKTQSTKVVLKAPNGPSRPDAIPTKEPSTCKDQSVQSREAKIRYRPLKLVYDHDIRLAQMPIKCTYKALRDVIKKRFPMSKSVLIKYKDCDGDFITITCSAELRLAESSADSIISEGPDAEKSGSDGVLRLQVVEVSPEHEPPVSEEDEEEEEEKEEEKKEEKKEEKEDETLELEKETEVKHECKEIEMDDWIFEFAQLFRAHVGVDPDAHIDLHEVGMELCSEALEEMVTSEAAQPLLDKAASKFQEVAALAFFNWGNVHMCAARKRMPIDESAEKNVMDGQLEAAHDWVKGRYTLAKEKYEEALKIKPDFYEGLLALGQQHFEMAKLQWSFVLAKKYDLSMWDPSETIGLFDSAEEKMKAATEMWERVEEQREKEPKEEFSKRRKKQEEVGGGTTMDVSPEEVAEHSAIAGGTTTEVSLEEVAEQAAVMRTQIHLFWGNMLFERSQVECKMGLNGWRKNLDDAVKRFKLAGASEDDISTVLKNHCSNEGVGDRFEGKVNELGGVVIQKGP